MDTKLDVGPTVTEKPPFSIFSIDNNTELGINDGMENHIPDFLRILYWDNIIPLLCYFILWYTINSLVTMHCWTTYQEGIKRRRLINVTTSLIHSSVSGIFLFVYFCRNTRLMFESPLYYYNYYESQIILLSIGYFFYDAYDLLANDKLSIATGILLFHHAASIFVLTTAIVSRKFLLYAYWALLMEVSSIFLHSRALLHISKLSVTTMIALSNIISYLNIAFFVIFRFLVQVFLCGWAWYNRNNFHSFYVWIAFGGGTAFLLINIGLFLRIIHSDGLLCSSVVQKERLDALLDDNEYTQNETERKELLV